MSATQSEETVSDVEFEDLSLEDSSEENSRPFETIYFKYLFENCHNIDDILERLRSLTEQFQQYKDEGHQLLSPVYGGWCEIDKYENE